MKRVLSFFLATLFITSFISSIGINAGQDNLPKETNITFAGGDGSQSNPYQVSTPEQLNAVRNDLSAHYVQINDIDMSTWGNWEPIGHAISSFGATHSFSDYSNEYFTGSYLGNNYKISNLCINDTSISVTKDSFGLFGAIQNSTIKCVILENYVININKDTTDYSYYWKNLGCTFSLSAGGVVGISSSSTISNCKVDGSIHIINCSNAYVGGIVGNGCGIINCTNNADIYIVADKDNRYANDSSVYCGGIVGNTGVVNGEVSKCINFGDITVTAGQYAYCGGVSGEYGLISQCVNKGSINCTLTNPTSYSSFAGGCNVGGIVGATSSDYVKSSINYGNVSAVMDCRNGRNVLTNCYAGGIVGYCGYYGSGSIVKCYNLSALISLYEIDSKGQNVEKSPYRIGRSIKISNCYSIDNTTLNGIYPTEFISPDDLNGGSLSKEEMTEIIKELLISILNNTYQVLGRIFDANIDYYTTAWNSTEYNANLSNLCCALSAAVYDSDKIESAYSTLGFGENFELRDYDGDFNPARCGYVISYKKSLYNDDTIFLITVRGSSNLSDWTGNISLATIEDTKHIGFAYPANEIYRVIQSIILSDSISGNIKFVITGHSRGAAVANLLAVKLMENGFSEDSIYDYNFACPDVACRAIFPEYNNIFNLCNRADFVPKVPGSICSLFTSAFTSWGKYGKTYWFTKSSGTVNPASAHDIYLYLAFFDQRLNPDKWGKSFLDGVADIDHDVVGFLTKIFCPVDVIVTDNNGNVMASIINGEVSYSDGVFGDVIAFTDGDQKIVYINNGLNYNISLIGTNTGEMTYSVEKYDLLSYKSYDEKVFSNVNLDTNKQFICDLPELDQIDKTQLFVVDSENSNHILCIVNTDGTESVYKIIYGDANGDGGADMKDVLLMRRAIAGLSEIDGALAANADLNGDGNLDMKDVLKLRRIIAGLEV